MMFQSDPYMMRMSLASDFDACEASIFVTDALHVSLNNVISLLDHSSITPTPPSPSSLIPHHQYVQIQNSKCTSKFYLIHMPWYPSIEP